MQVVRVATSEQAVQAFHLLQNMIAERGYGDKPIEAEFIRNVLENNGNIFVFVAYKNAEAVGVGVMSRDFSPYHGGYYGNLTATYVLPAHRNIGVAGALFAARKKQARLGGFKAMRWDVATTNPVSIGFFAKQEVKPTGDPVHEFWLYPEQF